MGRRNPSAVVAGALRALARIHQFDPPGGGADSRSILLVGAVAHLLDELRAGRVTSRVRLFIAPQLGLLRAALERLHPTRVIEVTAADTPPSPSRAAATRVPSVASEVVVEAPPPSERGTGGGEPARESMTESQVIAQFLR